MTTTPATTDYMQQHLRFAAPLNTAKRHNYLLVYDADDHSHFLDRYAERPTTLCGLPASTTEIEYDSMGYQLGVECPHCQSVLVQRVAA
jgi:hypothetical protein